VLIGAVALALAVAEGKAVFYSFTMRDVRHTVQGLLLDERDNLAGKGVFHDSWTRADRFVLEHVIGGYAREADGVDAFVRTARRGDYIVIAQPDGQDPRLVQVRANRRHRLCRRTGN